MKEHALFWSKVNKTDTCWLWTAYCVKGGYGRYTKDKKKHLAHRYAYTTCVGPIPEGHEVDHLCHTPACVRPDHLKAVTPQQNYANRRITALSNTGIIGISYRSRDDNYVATLRVGGKAVFRKYSRNLEYLIEELAKARIDNTTPHSQQPLPTSSQVPRHELLYLYLLEG